MSTTSNMSLAKGVTTTSNTTSSPPAGSGEGAKETKTVQTVDYRESVGQGQYDTRPVEVVHEISTKETDPNHAAKQD